MVIVPKSVNTPEYDRLRDLLIQARARADLSQVQLSRVLNKPQSYVSKYERGERRLDVIEFIEVCHALGLDPKEAIGQLQGEGSD